MFRAIPIRSGKRNLISLYNASQQMSSAAPTVSHGHHEVAHVNHHPRIGKREVVGFGVNGQPSYFDNAFIPMPAIRWAETDENIARLRQKAKGDWASLTVDEKKALYRADFRQTYAELINQSNGEWKFTYGFLLGLMGAAIWLYVFVRSQIYNYPRLETSSLEHQARMLERMIGHGVGRVHGVSSEWDYEKGDWKKN